MNEQNERQFQEQDQRPKNFTGREENNYSVTNPALLLETLEKGELLVQDNI